MMTPEELAKLKEVYWMHATHLEACYATGISEERHKQWYVHEGGKELIDQWMIEQSWNKKLKVYGKAEKIFLEPSDHKEAESVLKRHPLTKKDYSERQEHTGKDGEALFPKPILDLVQQDNSDGKDNQDVQKD
jgi:hypothetical protein